jgi:hypothetical protein
MDKYYRVLKDTFLWGEGAIISDANDRGHGYRPISDVWNKTKDQTEYITTNIIESENNKDYFERIYPDTLKSDIYRTAEQLKELYKSAFKN